MKHKLAILVISLFFTSQIFGQNTLNLNINQAKERINPEIYGHFSEHLGTCIYGGIYVGKSSKIPNIDGYRTDVVNALKEMKVPVLRWPGGCFADTYHWKDGIGPQEKRPSIVNVHWGGVTEDNSFGTHEFLNFCELIGTEPYLSINVGSGTVQEAAEWVEYVTSSNKSPMTDLRKKNGREDPWNVKFWGIGNETWGCGGEMRPEYYADVYRNFSCYVRGNDNKKIAVGPSGDDYNWTTKMMENLKEKKQLVQGLSLHYYTLPTGDWGAKGSSTNFGEEQWFQTLKRTLYIEDYIKGHLAIMDKYDPEKKISLAVDEWGTWYDPLPGSNPGFLQQQNTLRDALVAGVNLNIFNNHADRISMANIAQIINVLQSVILTKDDKMVLTPTYYVFKMYNIHQGATLVPLTLKCEDYEYKGEKIPSVNASSSIKDGVLSITLCNMNPNKPEPVECNLSGGQDYKIVNGKIINAQNISDYNDFGQSEKVTLKDFTVAKPKNGKLNIELPAHSVVLIQLQ
jgi:alpha-L-arabinofuranosidase